MSADVRIPITACDATDIDEANIHCEGCFQRFPAYHAADYTDPFDIDMAPGAARWERLLHVRTCVAYRDFVVEETLEFYARLDAERAARRA